MPSKRASRSRRRPAPDLPLELVTKIIEYLRVYEDWYPVPPKDFGIEDVAACALVSRVWHQAANEELYRHLTIQVKLCGTDGEESEDDEESEEERRFTTNSHLLEAALQQFPHLGALTRRVTVWIEEEVQEEEEEVEVEEAVVQSLGVVLLCCPKLVALEIESFHSNASFRLAELAASQQPKLEELAIRDNMEGSELESRFVKLLNSLPCLRKLDFDVPLDRDRAASEDDADSTLACSLTSLNLLGMYADEALRALPLRFASALSTLAFAMSEDHYVGLPKLTRFSGLRTLLLDLGGAFDSEKLPPLVEQINDLPVLETLSLARQGPWNADKRDVDLSHLPSTLARLDLTTVSLSYSSIAELLASPSREGCKVLWSEMGWSTKEQSKMDKLVGRSNPLRKRHVRGTRGFELLE
ncbi:hypothetical protein BCR35DRAFT_350150 [Leucosporidium creatinivorum]|uniref:F-box domain-containing protein n=1 Tax=Leucosporidium creatinivorum TaxID=106004 RepID=A0A1Y2G279_9BASI|nr:hypothetical protein BCR35DRAFT_350150 [Leucosporidium creatinivorum]